jgi:hypothetical protein
MSLAWAVLFPAGMAAARHLKPLGGPSFFYAHLAFNGVAFIFVLAAFGSIYQHVTETGGGEHFAGGFHTKLGLAVFILAWLQPAGGLARPAAPRDGEKPTRPRRLWELAHQAGGRLLLALALLACVSGIAMVPEHGGGRYASQTGVAMFVLWCVIVLGGGTVALEMLRKRREAGGTAAAAGGWSRVGA